MKKYWIITYGCQMNKSDSERIAGFLEARDYKQALKIEEANLIIVNMCSVRQSAVDRVYGFLSKVEKLKKRRRKLKFLLTGCFLKKDLNYFKKHFDFILHIKTLPLWKNFLKKEKYFYFPLDFRDQEFHRKFRINYLKIKPKYSSNFRAFVPIGTGCNNFCTFCVVPFTRGPEFSRPARDIISEIRTLARNNYKEIWLLGQNVDSYKSGKFNFAKLIQAINKIKGNFWLRFTSPHPKDFTKELIETIAKAQKVAPYINLPVQAGDNEVLKKMRRPYTVETYKEIITELRKSFKKYREGLESDPSLSTDIIVGFPGETKKQFKNTVSLVKNIKFDSVYLARYSSRHGTKAAEIKMQLSDSEKKRRERILQDIIKKISLKRNKRFINHPIKALIDYKTENFLFGKTRHLKTVKIEKPNKGKINLGDVIQVKILRATPFGLEGRSVIKKT